MAGLAGHLKLLCESIGCERTRDPETTSCTLEGSLRSVTGTNAANHAGLTARFRAAIFDGHFAPNAIARQMVGGSLMLAHVKRIAGFALKSRLPSVYDDREAVDAGGLMYYGADLADSYRRVATYVDKILKGAKPAELPVEQPTKFELAINLNAAKQIGLAIPPNVLARADKVIK